jgi:hypothetical protein
VDLARRISDAIIAHGAVALEWPNYVKPVVKEDPEEDAQEELMEMLNSQAQVDEEDEDFDGDYCTICRCAIDGKSRTYAIGPCNHRNCCCICVMRMRAVTGDISCAECREKNEMIIATMEDETFKPFVNRENLAKGLTVFHEPSSISFPKDFYDEVVARKWQFRCRVCAQTVQTRDDLQAHYIKMHNLRGCMLCWANKQVCLLSPMASLCPIV